MRRQREAPRKLKKQCAAKICQVVSKRHDLLALPSRLPAFEYIARAQTSLRRLNSETLALGLAR